MGGTQFYPNTNFFLCKKLNLLLNNFVVKKKFWCAKWRCFSKKTFDFTAQNMYFEFLKFGYI